MISAVLSRLARVRITLAYAATLFGVTTVLLAMGPAVQDEAIRYASTNLHNLGHGRLWTLVASAFVIDAGPMTVWLPGVVCVLGLAEWLWRSRRLVIAFVVGHLGATVLVAAGLAWAVRAGWAPMSVRWASDVGMSYGVLGALGALTAAIPVRYRPVWLGWWLFSAVAMLAVGRTFTDVGHVTALVLGMAVSIWFGRPARWRPLSVAVLVVAAAFGYLILAEPGVSAVISTTAGVVGAGLGALIARMRVPARP
jgi:hypothetical protein